MTFLSLFAGIGGFDLGLERAGMTCIGQVEIDPFCRKVLAKHWPNVPKWSDIREFQGTECERPDLICGGFPCQDISFMGKHAGIDGARSGLWSEFLRLIRKVRPRYVLVENVAAMLTRGIDRVLGSLAANGFDAEWACIPACAVGAPHIRDRVFIFAYGEGSKARGAFAHYGSGEATARRPKKTPPSRRCALLCGGDHWDSEPGICRVANGISANVDRVAVLGNAIVPQVAEWIGRRIMEANSRRGECAA